MTKIKRVKLQKKGQPKEFVTVLRVDIARWLAKGWEIAPEKKSVNVKKSAKTDKE